MISRFVKLVPVLRKDFAVSAHRSITTSVSPLLFRFTPVLCGEPLKKKKKLDPMIVKAREDRKRRKLEKEIRKLEKVARKFKPIDELELPPKILEEIKIRRRKLPSLSEEEIDYRSDLLKEWNRYKNQQVKAETLVLERMLSSQTLALEELRFVSEDLYLAALEPDVSTIPFAANGPVHTPPIENYSIVDGEYKDITKKWE